MGASKGFGSRLAVFGLMALALLAPLSSAEAAKARHAKQVRAVRVTSAPEKDAAIVVDGATGKVLYARNPDAIRAVKREWDPKAILNPGILVDP